MAFAASSWATGGLFGEVTVTATAALAVKPPISEIVYVKPATPTKPASAVNRTVPFLMSARPPVTSPIESMLSASPSGSTSFPSTGMFTAAPLSTVAESATACGARFTVTVTVAVTTSPHSVVTV